MTLHGSEHITITILKTTVDKLRAMKRADSWDSLLLRFSKRGRCGIECMNCGYWLETDETDVTLDKLAKRQGWTGVYGEEGEVDKGGRRMRIGYMCGKCGKRMKAK